MVAAKRDHKQAPCSLLILSTIPHVRGGALASEKEWVRKEVLPEQNFVTPEEERAQHRSATGLSCPAAASAPQHLPRAGGTDGKEQRQADHSSPQKNKLKYGHPFAFYLV